MVAQFVAEIARSTPCNSQNRVFDPFPEHIFRRHVGSNLRDIRESLNLTLGDLAKLSGYSRDQISKLENASDGSTKSDRVYNLSVALFHQACAHEDRLSRAMSGYRERRWIPTQASFDQFLAYIYTHRSF